MLQRTKISAIHQPKPVNLFDYGFNAYDNEQAWVVNKGEIPGSS